MTVPAVSTPITPTQHHHIKRMWAKILLNSHYPPLSNKTFSMPVVPLYGSNLGAVLDTRPDVTEYTNETGYSMFILKAEADVPSPRAQEALDWLEKSGLTHTRQDQIIRNCVWVAFGKREDAALFKLFWL